MFPCICPLAFLQAQITKSLLKFGISKGQTEVLIGFFGNDQDVSTIESRIVQFLTFQIDRWS